MNLREVALVMANARRLIKAKKITSNGRLYMELFGTGLGTARERCRQIGLDPDGNETNYTAMVQHIGTAKAGGCGMTQHTPEFLPEFEHHSNYGKRLSAGNDAVIFNRNQYNRARACVNACAGVDNETLRKIADKEMDGSEIFELSKVKQRHDELRRAAMQVIWQVKTQHMATNKTDAASKLARTIARLETIAKAGVK